jgi:hypothetical protein
MKNPSKATQSMSLRKNPARIHITCLATILGDRLWLL